MRRPISRLSTTHTPGDYCRLSTGQRNALTTIPSVVYAAFMTSKFFSLISVIGLASTCLVQGQSSTPGESPAASPSPEKHHAHKKAGAAASPAEKAASPSTAESPAASPSAKKPRSRKKPEATAAASPAPAKGTTAPATTKATPVPGGGPGMVWVSTDSHIYHKQGSRFYGKTKNGKYMSEADAIKAGNRAARQEH
jgi:hypothetical protein